MPPELTNIFKKRDGKSKLLKTLVRRLNYRNIFCLTFLLGTIFIVLGWLLDDPYYIWGVVLPVLCMLAYSFVGFIEENNEAVLEQFADSIYYLGFLLTLVALIVSLIVFSEADYSLKGVGSRFGIALITTVIGLFLRILLTNFRSSFSDKKTIVEGHLTKAMIDFNHQVRMQARAYGQTTELYNSSIKHAIDSMEKSIEVLTSGLDSVATQGVSQVTTTFQNTNEQLSLGITNLFKKIESIKIPDDILVSPIQEPIKKLAALLDEYKDGFASVTQEQKQISKDNKLFATNINKLNQSTLKLDNSIQRLADTSLSSVKALDINTSSLNDTIEKTMSTIDELSSVVSDTAVIQPNIQNFIKSIADIGKETQKLSEIINNHRQNISKIEDITNSHLGAVKKHQKEIEEIMKKSRTNLDLLNDGLIRSTQFITDEIGRGSGGG